MATHARTQEPRIPRTAFPSPTFRMESPAFRERLVWVEIYRAAVLETEPQARLEKISQADASLQLGAERPLDPRERDAIAEAREILTLLREGIERRVGHTSWPL